MSKYSAIKAATNAYIKTNGRQEITGAILNAVMIATIDSLGKFYQSVGVAVPATDPGVIDQNVAYLAGTPGTYTHLGGFEVERGEIAVIKFDGEWHKETLYVIPTRMSDLVNDAGYITKVVSDLVNYYTKNDVQSILSSYYDKDQVDSMVSAVSRQSYVVAWDGTAEPVVGDIPAGVSVTWDGNAYVGTLPASASTIGRIYLVSNGDGYDEYITSDNNGYAWIFFGTTSIDLSGYVNLSQFTRLEAKVDDNNEGEKATTSVAAVKTMVDLSTLPLRSYLINANGVYGTSNTYKHNVIPVSPGDTLLVTAGDETAYLAWLASKKEPTSGGTPIYAPGYSGRFTIASGTAMELVVPDGAFYLYVYRGAENDSYPYTPDSVIIVNNANDGVLYKSKETTKTPFILRDDQNAIILCKISNGGKINSSLTTGDRGYYIPVSMGQKVRIWATTLTSHDIAYGFCPSLPEVGTQLTNYYVSPFVYEMDDIVDVPYDGYFFVARNTGYFTTKFQFSVIERSVAWNDRAEKATTLAGYGITDAYTKDETDAKVNSFAIEASVDGDGDTLMRSKYFGNVIPGNTYRVYIKNPDVSMDGVTIGADGYRFAVYFYDENKSLIVRAVGVTANRPLKDNYDVSAPSGAAYLRVGARCAVGSSLLMLLVDVTAEGVSSLANIVDANPDSEFIPKMMAAKKRYYTSTLNNLPYPFVLAHLSDIHGNWANVARFIEWCNHHSSRIDLLVNTGDTAENTYDSSISGYLAIDGVENIINVIGNHDTRSSEDTSDWQAHTGIDAYNKFIAPFVEYWDVIQPVDAAETGKCYFYKDDAERSLRLLFVDIMDYDATQDSWVRGILADARTNGYHTLIVTHFAPARSYAERNEPTHEVVECNYSSLYGSGSDSSNLTAYNVDSYLLGEAVHDYMQDGGVFIGYLGGHYHREIIAKQAKYSDQMFFAVGATKVGEHRDYIHTTGTRDQDEFEIVSIDTYVKTITFYKVGANVDKYGRHKNSICIKYDTGTIKAEAF